MAELIWQHATNGNDQTARQEADTEWAQIEEIEGEVDDVEELDPVYQRYADRIRTHTVDDQMKIKLMYELNLMFTLWSTKVYSLVPLCLWEAKYITIDTDGLYYLLGGKPSLRLERGEFGQRQQEFWRQHFNLPARLFTEDIEQGHQLFDFMITTDGVGVSVHICRWKQVWRYDETPEQRQERLERARAARQELLFARIRQSAEQENLHWVGVDPGRQSMLTAATLDPPRWSYQMTSKQYHHEIKANDKSHHRQFQVQRNGLGEWQTELRTMKTHSAGSTIESLRDLFSTPHLSRMFAICFNRTIKHKRFRTYIHKQRTLEKICQELIDNHNPHRVIFAYGMGGFNMRTRGYKPSPSKHRWITSRLIKLGALVVNINEYNTSQVCSSCFQGTKLCAVGSRQDPFVTRPVSVAKPHFVRRCTNNICRTIWNRDINAACNMVYLALHKVYGLDRPEVFSVQLPQPEVARDPFRGEH
jgi:hypothetical protein